MIRPILTSAMDLHTPVLSAIDVNIFDVIIVGKTNIQEEWFKDVWSCIKPLGASSSPSSAIIFRSCHNAILGRIRRR